MIILNKRNLIIIIILIIMISIILFSTQWLKKIDPTILTLISGGLGFAISKFIEDLKESKQRIY